jgi:hypothetical protein
LNAIGAEIINDNLLQVFDTRGDNFSFGTLAHVRAAEQLPIMGMDKGICQGELQELPGGQGWIVLPAGLCAWEGCFASITGFGDVCATTFGVWRGPNFCGITSLNL